MKFSSLFLVAAAMISAEQVEAKSFLEEFFTANSGGRYHKSINRHEHAFEKMKSQSASRAAAGAAKTDDVQIIN